MKNILFLVTAVLFLSGCSTLKEASRSFWGSSTRELEQAKADSIYQIYSCEASVCFDAVLRIARENKYYVFMKDELRGLVVLMNIPGCVDTTEVGIFLTELPQGQGVKIELSSRSSLAKKTVAKVLFTEMPSFLGQ